MKTLERLVHERWYHSTGWNALRLLTPVSHLYAYLQQSKAQQGRKLASTRRLPVPVIVVGNLTAGGAGKTPLTMALIEFLRSQGMHPGVISRGYGRNHAEQIRQVTHESSVYDVGDEPLLMFQQTSAPIVVGSDRFAAARYLLDKNPAVDILVCDDGLQHYLLPRDIEIVVIDGALGFGNGKLLPAGPLRESVERLQQVDFCVINGKATAVDLPKQALQMRLQPMGWSPVTSGVIGSMQPLEPTPFQGRVHALAGIGNPQRFFDSLAQLQIEHLAHPFDDHHRFQAQDLHFEDGLAIVMTAKDAVKCAALPEFSGWVLHVQAVLEPPFWEQLHQRILDIQRERSATDTSLETSDP